MTNMSTQNFLVAAAILVVLGDVASTGQMSKPPLDVMPKQNATSFSEDLCVTDPGTFVCKWTTQGGYVVDSPGRPGSGYLQVAATTTMNSAYHNEGTEIVLGVVRHMPPSIFDQLASTARVGLFTFYDKTTIFPEYVYYRDRPECEGTCAGQCSNTCTGDGRKYDDLAGVGGIRATCLDDNFMCTGDDPYGNVYSVLVHEFAHTIHQYAVPADWFAYIDDCYDFAYYYQIWDIYSYAMVNSLEYFAEASGVYFHTNFHGTSSGGMNSCGNPGGFCSSESEARQWLANQDSCIYEALSYIYTNGQDTNPGGITVCP